MGWAWHFRLFWELVKDPGSHLAAAINGWEYPVSREWMVAADQYDAFVAANTHKGRPKPYPRPWRDQEKKQFGRATRPQSEIRAALAMRGH